MNHPLSLKRILSSPKCALIFLCCLSFSSMARDIPVELGDEWVFSNGEEYPGGKGSLEAGNADNTLAIAYDFKGGGQYVAAGTFIDASGELDGAEVTATGPGGNLGVVLTDNTDQHFIFRLGQLEDSEKTFDLPLDKPSSSYGGADDKTLHFPIKGIRLIIEKNPSQLEGTVTVSKIVLHTK